MSKQTSVMMTEETRQQMDQLRERLERVQHAMADMHAEASAKLGLPATVTKQRVTNAETIRFALNALEKSLDSTEAAMATVVR